MNKEITLRQLPHERVSMVAGLTYSDYMLALSERVRRAVSLADLVRTDVMNGRMIDGDTISCSLWVQDVSLILHELVDEAEALVDELDAWPDKE